MYNFSYHLPIPHVHSIPQPRISTPYNSTQHTQPPQATHQRASQLCGSSHNFPDALQRLPASLRPPVLRSALFRGLWTRQQGHRHRHQGIEFFIRFAVVSLIFLACVDASPRCSLVCCILSACLSPRAVVFSLHFILFFFILFRCLFLPLRVVFSLLECSVCFLFLLFVLACLFFFVFF